MNSTFRNLPEFSRNCILTIFYLMLVLNSSCKKLVETEAPKTGITGKNVYLNNSTAIAVLTGLYTKMSGLSVTSGNVTTIGFLTGFSSDELTLYNGIDDKRYAYYTNNLISDRDYDFGYSFWTIIYPKIYIVNAALEGLTNSSTLNSKVKAQLLGEAKFMRAFYYFYLVNLYGDVPLALNSDYSINLGLPRMPKDQVWKQIIDDLKDAQNELSPDYMDISLLNPSPQRVRPTKWAATALLARAYLYIRDWKNAEIESSKLIGNSGLYHLEKLNEVFKNTSSEAIWQLQPVNAGRNTEDAQAYLITDFGPGAGTNGGGYISDQLLQSFEDKDQRKTSWINWMSYEGKTYYYPYKYKASFTDVVSEYHTVFRLAEQYLIKAEALAEQGNYTGAITNLDIIRERAGLSLFKDTNPGMGPSDLRTAILKERQHELFTEWGHRWLDLKRTSTIDAVMPGVTTKKGGKWNTNWKLYPIPSEDIRLDKNIIQNPGY